MLVETWTRSACNPSARTSSVGAHGLRDLLRGLKRRVDLDVEGHQRRPRGHERGARGGVRRRAEVGGERRQVAPQLRPRPPAREFAVEIHGHAELPELVGEHERLGARRAALALVEVDDRRDVEDAHARVDALVRVEVDPRDRLPRPGQHGLVQLARGADQREHGPVMDGVGGGVDQPGPEGGGDRVERRGWSRPSETLGTAIIGARANRSLS